MVLNGEADAGNSGNVVTKKPFQYVYFIIGHLQLPQRAHRAALRRDGVPARRRGRHPRLHLDPGDRRQGRHLHLHRVLRSQPAAPPTGKTWPLTLFSSDLEVILNSTCYQC